MHISSTLGERGVSPLLRWKTLRKLGNTLVDGDPHTKMDRIRRQSRIARRKFRLIPCRATKTRDSGWNNKFLD